MKNEKIDDSIPTVLHALTTRGVLKEQVKQKGKAISSHLDRKSVVSMVWLFNNAHVKFVTLKLALPTRK